ncbi:MAG: TetR/AcrR family transcriptional regulator C-terminal domain-containing protein [Atopobiaceae bacterium]|nr:TetR/AcrR family transcriptional regulator C-terminal domain-containing protein [Atopobiaceae bacterium]
MEQVLETPRVDRRTARTRKALRDALADEILATGDLSQVTVTAVADRAGITRRTFYSHYKDIPALVRSIEDEAVADLSELVRSISGVTLDELERELGHFGPCPGSEEVLAYFKRDARLFGALLGEGGDPAFAERLKDMVRNVVQRRAHEGFTPIQMSPVAESVFDYYLTFVISAEVGVVVRWLTTGAREPVEVMARMMTALLFVRPGDLYGRPINFDVPAMAARAADLEKELKNVS